MLCSGVQARGVFILLMISCSSYLHGQDSLSVMTSLKKLSLEELMNVEIAVFSVSKRNENLSEVASAIQVITGEEIRRSSATSIPEALRLLSNLQVAQLASEAWVISARGFNALFSNKLLVMIDGRTVYSPLFAGVFWDAQNVLLEEIERIEVVSGPGGTLWGANAVNGVINIITKNSKDSQGWYASSAVGSYLENYNGVRYGGSIRNDLSYRVYLQRAERGHTYHPANTNPLVAGLAANDAWDMTQGGFRMDYVPSEQDQFVLQGDFYGSDEYTEPDESGKDGQNVLARWTHSISERSGFILQLYYDATWLRDIPSTFSDNLKTYDVDFQHSLQLGKRHNLLWGTGYRFMKDVTQNSTPFVGFVPRKRDMDLFSSFLQDEIAVSSHFKVIVGSKFLHNEFTGFEFQPSARIAWIPDIRNTIWTAVSRNVRTPSRIDVDYHLPVAPQPPTAPSVAGGPDFVSEKLIAWELGYRVHPDDNMSLSIGLFYNDYRDLYSVDSLPGTYTYQIMNGSEGTTQGVELTGTVQVLDNWRIRAGYTYFLKELSSKSGNDEFDLAILGNDAKHQALIHSMINLPGNFQFDFLARYRSKLPDPEIPEYLALDVRLGWTYRQLAELSVCGQNLLKYKHQEFAGFDIPRNIYGKVTFRF